MGEQCHVVKDDRTGIFLSFKADSGESQKTNYMKYNKEKHLWSRMKNVKGSMISLTN